MSKFVIRKRLGLGFLGEEWKDCHINVSPMSPDELRERLSKRDDSPDTKSPAALLKGVDETAAMLKSHFVDGKGFTDGGIIDLTADDIQQLPVEVSSKLSSIIMGEVDPNSSTPSAV